MSPMIYGKLQKMTAALLALWIFMWICSSAQPALADSVQVRSAPLVSDSAARNGMVRVYLSSLGNPTSLDLTIKGNYSLSTNGKFLENGSQVKVSFQRATGSLTLTVQGQSVQVGKKFSLRRHSASGSNGILIAQSRDSQNPYPGDLSFEAVYENGQYTLYTIAHVFLEDYLYGVLPYEMGNSSGKEALKAQAVAARTYTVRMMENRASGRYDVKDTTSDQVYRGTPSGNANCVAAVNDTKGIVLMYGSSYITTYYSASNGGQTETARTGASYAYMKVKDDPFDYANASSVVRKTTLHADLQSSLNPPQLLELLRDKAVASLKRSGYPASYANTNLQTLKGVTPHTPMYASPSRLYTQMDFTFTVSTQNASGQNLTVTLTETCNIFTELESMLGMSIQSLNNELWSVQKEGSSFVLQARRYGHGMGMSQRGAMQMASLGYSYDQILGFYYDGCSRVKQSFTNRILSASSGDEQITVESPSDLEPSDPESCTGVVTLAGNTSVLAIRSSVDSSAPVIGTAANGVRLEVCAQRDSWYQVRFGELVGFVPASAVVVSGTPGSQEKEASSVLGFAVVTANDFVNLRSSGSMSARIAGTAPSGAVLTVFSISGSWAKVQYQSLPAYANINYLSSVTKEYPFTGLDNGSRKALITTESGTGTVNLRQSASVNAAIADQLAVGTAVTILSSDSSWCYVSVGEKTGYILAEYLQYTDDNDSPPLQEQPEAEDPEEKPEDSQQGSQSLYAVVQTVSGSLNLRFAANTGSRILTTIPRGAAVSVQARGEEWAAVSYQGYTGFVMAKYLSFSESFAPETDENANGSEAKRLARVVTPGGTLNFRLYPEIGSRILKQIPADTIVEVLEKGPVWTGIRYMEAEGYVMTSYLVFDVSEEELPSLKEEEPETSVQPPAADTASVHTQSGSLNLRMQPDLNSGILTSIPQNAQLKVTAYGNEWCSVRYGEYEGYVMTAYLRFEDRSSAGTERPPETETPAETVQGEAWVITPGGSLNLRQAPDGNAEILASVPQYARVLLLENGAEWSRISYENQNGYVMTRYLTSTRPSQSRPETDAENAGAADSDEPEHDYVTVGGIVLDVSLEVPPSALFAETRQETRIYRMCVEDPEEWRTIPAEAEVEILQTGRIWCRIAYQDEQGYCLKENLREK